MRCDAGPANNKRGPIRDPRARRDAYMQACRALPPAAPHWLSLGRQECHVGVVGGDVASSRVQRHGQLIVCWFPLYAGRAVGARHSCSCMFICRSPLYYLFTVAYALYKPIVHVYKNLPSSVHSHRKFHVPEPPE